VKSQQTKWGPKFFDVLPEQELGLVYFKINYVEKDRWIADAMYDNGRRYVVELNHGALKSGSFWWEVKEDLKKIYIESDPTIQSKEAMALLDTAQTMDLFLGRVFMSNGSLSLDNEYFSQEFVQKQPLLKAWGISKLIHLIMRSEVSCELIEEILVSHYRSHVNWCHAPRADKF